MNFAINGFGRIGKCILRAYITSHYKDKHLNCAVINAGYTNIKNALHLFKYDSTHGRVEDVNIIDKNTALIQGHEIKFLFEDDLKLIDWSKYNVDVVLDCTGKFTKKSLAKQHMESGAKKVIVSAPCEDADVTIVYGVNEHVLKKEDLIISIGSCTTNCLAPVAELLNDSVGIETGFMTTIHAYTGDQSLLDRGHKDLQRARAAALSIIPSSTGAAKAIGLVIPELSGKIDGVAVRVPVHNVSMIDFTFTAKRSTSVEELNNIFRISSKKSIDPLVLGYVNEPLVSIDFLGNEASSVFDATQTKVIAGRFCRVVSWYDNEWGFSNRMLDVTKLIGDLN
jgi:glyceraldehyde 3-phosphate dehydrogenase